MDAIEKIQEINSTGQFFAQPDFKLTDKAAIEEKPIKDLIADDCVKIIYPFHGSEQEKSALVIGFSTDEIQVDKNSQNKKIASITILLPYLHEAASRISYRKPCRYEVESLSTREKQCLIMVAQGIVANNIAEKLGVSNRTVKHHIDSAREKLGATTRCRAVVIAILRGDINPN